MYSLSETQTRDDGDALMMKQYRPWPRAALAAVLLAGTSLGGYCAGHMAWADNAAPVNPASAPAAPSQPLSDFTKLVTQVKPAVVSITTKLQATPAALEDDGDNDQGPAQRNGQ